MALAIALIKCILNFPTQVVYLQKGMHKMMKMSKFVLHEELGCSYTDLEENQESNCDLIPAESIKPIPIDKLSESNREQI